VHDVRLRQGINQAGKIGQVSVAGCTVVAIQIEDAECRGSGDGVHVVEADQDVVLGVRRVQGELARGGVESALHDVGWKAHDVAIPIDGAACAGEDLPGRSVVDPDPNFGQDGPDSLVEGAQL
jgi:hypothetical protein